MIQDPFAYLRTGFLFILSKVEGLPVSKNSSKIETKTHRALFCGAEN